MKVETLRFGVVELAEKDVIEFTQPILGFADCTRFFRVEIAEKESVFWLQSVDKPEVAFIVMDPLQVLPDYEVRIVESDVADLHLEDEKEAEVLTLVVVPKDTTQVRTNLKAPIVFNPRLNLAKQVVLHESNYPIRYYLHGVPPKEEEVQEPTDAGSHAERK